MSFYPLSNIRGIELEPFAVALARVTLWMGHKLSVDELGLNERTLPLADLSGIRQADALRCEWPTADAIIGNPPFHGAGNLRGVLGDDYVEWLRKTFNCGVKDLCVYWFRKAAEGMTPGQRAGLVATNSVSQNLGRSASLDYLLEKGGVITEAVSTQVWPGEANVHVSIVNWRNGAAPSGVLPILNGEPVERISSSLRAEDEPAPVKALAKNRGRCFEGPSPKSPGFIITPTEASLLLERKDADYARVVRPYLTARDIANDPKQAASRWAIDFGMMPLEDAQRFPAALEIVEFRVKPDRLGKKRAAYRKNWWRFDRPRAELRSALAPLDRFIACPGHAKRVFFVWCDSWVCASNATDVFAFSDDYSMGVLSSSTHTEWARARSSTLKGDIRYTPTTAFATFPWPQASDSQRAEISALSIELHALRSQLCSTHELGLTKLYNSVDDGAFEELRAVHLSLDRAVAAAYGWPKSIAQDPTETNPRLQELNRQIAEGEIEYAPFE
jgi:hypothetical protein